MRLSPSAHVDTFCRDNLPPQEQWPVLRFDVPEVQYPERLNCAVELLDAMVARHGRDRPCLLAPDGTRWTYGDLLDRANRIAHVLVDDLGLVPGNRVLLRGPNNPWLVAAGSPSSRPAAWSSRPCRCCAPASWPRSARSARSTLALCDHRFTEDLAAAQIPNLTLMTYGPNGTGGELDTLAEEKPADFQNVDTAADDVSMLAFTSGTTGRPKATMHFHRDVLANADTFSHYVLRPEADDVFTGTPPIAFTFGLGGLVVFPLRVGAASAARREGDPGRAGRAHRRARRHRLLHRPHGVQGDDRRRQDRQAVDAAARGLRRRAPPPGHLGGLRRRDRGQAHRRDRRRPRCCTSSSPPPTTTSGRAPPASRSPATSPRWSTSTATRSPTASPGASRCRAPPAAATSPTSGSWSTSRTAGTSPATPSSATPTATSGTRRAATT